MSDPTPPREPFWRRMKPLHLGVLAAVALIVLLGGVDRLTNPEGVPYAGAGSVLERVTDGDVVEVEQRGGKIVATTEAGEEIIAYVPSDLVTDVVADIDRACAADDAECASDLAIRSTADAQGSLLLMAVSMLPFFLLLGMIFYLMRSGGGIFGFGQSKAKQLDPERTTVTFEDVAGVSEAKLELAEVVDFLRNPDKYLEMGARIPHGVLLAGPPGTGKTLLSKAVATEAGVPFFHASASEFIEMVVGVGAARMRDLFTKARAMSPAIIFIDEIDAIGRSRGGAHIGGGHDEREQTLNQLLVEMDGFDEKSDVIIIAATNRPDVLDAALLRPGRFDRTIILDAPDLAGREAILGVHGRGKPLGPDADLRKLARETPGMSGADLANVMNEAAINAVRRSSDMIAMRDLREAVERVIAGPERMSHLMNEEEKYTVAVHETGHALVQHLLPGCDPVVKVTIVSRGMALGYTMAIPEYEKRLKSRAAFRDQIAGLLGGNAAELVFFGEMTTGAANDMTKATEIARKMATEWGMVDALGPVVIEAPRLDDPRKLTPLSEDTARAVDGAIRELLEEGRERARQLLRRHRNTVEVIARRLMEVETLDAVAFAELAAPALTAEQAAGNDETAAA